MFATEGPRGEWGGRRLPRQAVDRPKVNRQINMGNPVLSVLCKHSPLHEVVMSPRRAKAETEVRNAMPGRQSQAVVNCVGDEVRYADLVPPSQGSMTGDVV